jgi:uncharacterized protein (TIGR03083 family)
MTPTDPRLTAAAVLEVLQPRANEDWTRIAGELDWDCRAVLEHMTIALDRYALYLAGPASERLPFQMSFSPESSIVDILRALELRAAVLCQVARSTPAGTRGYHSYGRPDAEGYLAMGCIELLIHADDIARGLGTTFTPPTDLVARVLERLFPWAPTDVDPWLSMQWVTGRIDLPGRSRVGPDWAWHASPRSEWDGEVKTQASYRR